MRINLECPYSEKDEAKALGARWDMARKTWYAVDPDDLQPFLRWIKSAVAPAVRKQQKAVQMDSKSTVTIGRMYVDVPHPLGVLPWEDEDPPELIRLVREIGAH